MASIEGLRSLLEECADLRTDLVAVHLLHSNGDGDGVFSDRQQNRTLELQEAAKEMKAVLASLPRQGRRTGGPVTGNRRVRRQSE